jgi:hypothetical protein
MLPAWPINMRRYPTRAGPGISEWSGRLICRLDPHTPDVGRRNAAVMLLVGVCACVGIASAVWAQRHFGREVVYCQPPPGVPNFVPCSTRPGDVSLVWTVRIGYVAAVGLLLIVVVVVVGIRLGRTDWRDAIRRP